MLGTASLEEWQLAVETYLADLKAHSDALGEARDRADNRLDDLERGRRELERALSVITFNDWLALEQPHSDLVISVVMATRNRAEYLSAAIDSVRSQRHQEWELLVVDDGSTDATAEMLAEIQDPRIRVLHVEHVGVCAARNVALAKASGEVITYLDDDNIMHPGWLQAVAWAFDRDSEHDVLYGARLIDDSQAEMSRSPGGLPFLHFVAFDRERLERGNIADMNVIAHRRAHPEAKFDEQLSQLGDWELFARLTEVGDPLELPATACAYRTTTSGRLSDLPEPQRDAEYELVQTLFRSRAARRHSASDSASGA